MSTVQTSDFEQVSEAHPVKQEREAISLGDESALSWYFGQGLSIYDKSTFGAVLQRITLDGFSSGPCEACKGEGILDAGGFAVSTRCLRCDGRGKPAERSAGESERHCPDCRGSGVVEPYEVRAEHGGWCDSCRGSGCTAIARRAARRPKCSTCKGAKFVDGFVAPTPGVGRDGAAVQACAPSCPDCLGTGWEMSDAMPATKADSSAGVIPDDSALTRFAITSRRLSSVKARSPALYSALECYYGDVGSRWGREDFGRLFALYALTPSGKRLARWGEGKPEAKAETAAAKKTPRAAWQNPKPTPGANPFIRSFREVIEYAQQEEKVCRKKYPRGIEKLGEFIGPRRVNGGCYARDPMLARRSTEEERAADVVPADDLTPQQRIWSQVAAEKRQPKRERTALLMAAHKQATELLTRALVAWEKAGGMRADAATKRLAKLALDRGLINLGTHMAVQAAGR